MAAAAAASSDRRPASDEDGQAKRARTDFEAYARELRTRGVVVVPLFSHDEVAVYHRDMLAELHKMPEFVDASSTSRFVEGGFGALGNSSSFHHPVVRALRADMRERTRAFFQKLQPQAGWNLEQLMDRTSLRRAGTSTSAETWHRDQSPTADAVLGGWVNLDADGGSQQHFSCSPASHHMDAAAAGFVKASEAEIATAKLHKTVVAIPPGSWVVFYQNLVHEVYPHRTARDSLRQYVGFRLTQSLVPLWEEARPDADFFPVKGSSKAAKAAKAAAALAFNWQQRVFHEQGPPPLPSGQYPPMWPKLALNFRKDKLEEWSAELLPVFVSDKRIPLRFMPSLAAAGLPLFPAYTAAEIATHTPQPLHA